MPLLRHCLRPVFRTQPPPSAKTPVSTRAEADTTHSPSFFFQPLSAFGSVPNLPAQETRTTRRSDTDKPGPAHLTPSPIKPIHPSSFASHITTFKISWLLTECLFCKWPCHWILCHTKSSYMFVTCHLLLMFDQQSTQKNRVRQCSKQRGSTQVASAKRKTKAGIRKPSFNTKRSPKKPSQLPVRVCVCSLFRSDFHRNATSDNTHITDFYQTLLAF